MVMVKINLLPLGSRSQSASVTKLVENLQVLSTQSERCMPPVCTVSITQPFSISIEGSRHLSTPVLIGMCLYLCVSISHIVAEDPFVFL